MIEQLVARYNVTMRQANTVHTGKLYSYQQPERIHRELVLSNGERFDIASWTFGGELTTTAGDRYQLFGGKEVMIPQYLASEDFAAGLKR